MDFNQNRFWAAARVLLGKSIVRVTFPEGYYHLHGMLIVEGSARSLQVLGASASTLPASLPQMRVDCLHGFDVDTCPLEHDYPYYPAKGGMWRRFWARLRLKIRTVRRA